MERLTKDTLSLILSKISKDEDRKSCTIVSKLWHTAETETRTRVRLRVSILSHRHIPKLLSQFPSLTDLTLYRSIITDQSLSLVALACPNLRSLDLSKSKSRFTDAGIIAVATACRLHLSVLNLPPSATVTDGLLAVLANVPSLTELYLQDCPLITDVGLNSLSNGPASCSLIRLWLQQCCEITDAGVSSLKMMTCLEDLNLSKCAQSLSRLTDSSGFALATISTLRKLDLSGQYLISDYTLSALAKDCSNLKHICLSYCYKITGEGLVSLASSLPLEIMDMSLMERNYISHYDVLQIAKRCPSLKRMYVTDGLEARLTELQKKRLYKQCYVEWR